MSALGIPSAFMTTINSMSINMLRINALLSLVLAATLIPTRLAFPDDSGEILKRLEQMEAEMATLKAALKKQQAVKKVSTPANAANSKQAAAEAAPPLPSSPAEIDESMFRPQGQSVTATSAASSKGDDFEKRVKELGQFGITYRSDGFKADALRFGAYGESIFGRERSGDGWQDGFDANRMVLLGTYQLSENIIFNTEIEFEHGGIAKEADDKLDGAVEVEQVFADFRVNEYFNWRSPGLDVIPVGFINLFHEPTQFYSTKRPELYHDLIPATWVAPSTSAYGKIVDGLNYQLQLSTGLEDSGTTASDGGKVRSGGYEAGISGSEGLGMARAPIGDRQQLNNDLAYTLRLSYAPYLIPGLAGSTSYYYTKDTTVRGAYGTNSDGTTRPLGGSSLGMFDTEVRYRIPKTGFELRSEYTRTDFGNTDNLRANNDADATNNVGNNMHGYSFEAAYHLPLSSSTVEPWEFVPFYRYSKTNLQTSGVRGSDSSAPAGVNNKEYHTFGAALFPTPKIVLKVDYQFINDEDGLTPTEEALLGAVGFFF